MATFTAAAIQSAFVNIAMDLDVSIQSASYLTSLVICILGVAPLFWRPLADRWGRLPIFLVSLIGSLVANIGCANSPTYGSMAACRAIVAFFISPAAAIGSAVVAELFFRGERARYMGIWTVMVTIGVPVSPFIFGFVALRVDYRWIYYILAIVSKSSRTLTNEANTVADQRRPDCPVRRFGLRDALRSRLGSFLGLKPWSLGEHDFIQTHQPASARVERLSASTVACHAPLRLPPGRLLRDDLRLRQYLDHD